MALVTHILECFDRAEEALEKSRGRSASGCPKGSPAESTIRPPRKGGSKAETR